MKKCRQCGLLSADSAVMCRHCKAKFTADDKPIVVKEKKKKSVIFTIIPVAIATIVIAVFALYQTGLIKTWTQSSEIKDLQTIAQEFVQADYEKDVETVGSYMFEEYIRYHARQGTFSLNEGEYTTFYFSAYNPEASMEILSVSSEILDENFDIYASEIAAKYAVIADEIASVYVEVQITDGDFVQSTVAPLTIIRLDNMWYVLPRL
ncbi:MAG: hypothetical protein IKY44_06255 [Clostridia bacterium]|nr:hypothetical protein [Clostridia bacterium]